MSDSPSSLRVALAHHWLVGMRGGEKVLEQICQVLPRAPIYTLVAQPAKLSPILREHPIHTSWLQRVPGGAKQYKKLLPLFPRAVSSLRVKDPVDLVVSSDASVIKGLDIPPGVPHICYCHSPPRYLWDLQKDYTTSSEVGGPLGRALFNGVVPYVREFDRQAAGRVTHFIANSNFVRDRIMTCYGRKSDVIHPPVCLDEFEISPDRPDDFYLVVSQLVPYKRIDLAVAAFTRLNRKLVVIGEGFRTAPPRKYGRSEHYLSRIKTPARLAGLLPPLPGPDLSRHRGFWHYAAGSTGFGTSRAGLQGRWRARDNHRE